MSSYNKLSIKLRGNNGKEAKIGEITVNIASTNAVFNAIANDLKVMMDYSVSDVTIVVCDGDKEIIARRYPVVSMLVPKPKETNKAAK